MLDLWRKVHTPQAKEPRKAMQTQKATAPACRPMGGLKPPYPHKEEKSVIK
jgi:hypothetical protein